MYFLSNICESSALLKTLKFITELIRIVLIIIPIGLIAILSLDLTKAALSNDEQSMGKSKKIALKRIIMVVILFLVPNIVRLSLSMLEDSNTLIFKNYDTCIDNMDNIEHYEKLEKIKEKREQEEKLKEQQNAIDKIKEEQNKKVQEAYSNRSNAPINSNDGSIDGTYNGKTYKLSEQKLKRLTQVCINEQGTSEKGIKAEASIMANLYELKGKKRFKNIYEYVFASGWFNSNSLTKTPNISKRHISYVKSVLVNGNRTLPLYIDEHDCIKCSATKWDIEKIKVNGKNITSESGRLNKKNYIKDKTIIYNTHGSIYKFYKFPTKTSDPFGYTKNAYKKIKG